MKYLLRRLSLEKKLNSLKLQLGMLHDLQIMGTYKPIRSSPNWLNIFEGTHGYPGENIG